MSIWYVLLLLLFIIVAAAMILIILVQRSQGGGLAGAFGGAGGGGTDTLFGGRVGDALTWATVVGFIIYLLLAVTLNKMEVTGPVQTVADETAEITTGETEPGTTPVAAPSGGEPITLTPTTAPAGFGNGGASGSGDETNAESTTDGEG